MIPVRRSVAALVSLVVLASTVSACGTRLSLSKQQQEAAEGGGLGLTDPSEQPTAGGSIGASEQPVLAGAATPSAIQTSEGTSAGESAVPTIDTTGVPKNAPIRIGVVSVTYASFAPIFGADGSSTNYFGMYVNMFAALNKRGGLAGHPIQPVYTVIDGGASSADTAAESACAKLTSDNKVKVVLAYNYFNEVFVSCLQKAGIGELDLSQFAYDEQGMHQHPNLLLPEALAMDRYMQALLDVSYENGHLTKKDTLGLLMEDCPLHRRVYANVVVPWGKAHGIKIVQTSISCYQGFDQIGGVTAQLQGAALKLHSEGATKIACMSASEGFCVDIFSKGASSQGYYPGYLLTSNGFPYTNTDTSQAVSMNSDQLKDVSAIGWAGHIDLGPRAPVTPAQAVTQKLCRGLDPTFGGHASDTTSARENYQAFFYAACDTILILERIVAKAGITLPFPLLRQVYATVAPDLAGAGLTSGHIVLRGGRADGVGYVLAQSYKKACSCFTADGGLRAIS